MIRPSLYADMPLMRDGEAHDAVLKALERCARIQDNLLSALKSEKPQEYLDLAFRDAMEITNYVMLAASKLTEAEQNTNSQTG